MKNYEEIVRELLDDDHIRIKENELNCCCPFHNEKKPSFGINLDTGLFNCFSCKEKGNIVQFVSKMKHISIAESIDFLQERGYDIEHDEKMHYYTLKQYADEKKLDIDYLRDTLNMENDKECKSIRIPYYDEENNQIAIRYRNSPTSKSRFWWSKNSRPNLYGLQFLSQMPKEYVILVEGESDCHACWTNNIYALGVPGAKNFKKEYAKTLEKFETIYIHQEIDEGGSQFVKKICQCIPEPDRIKVISAYDVDDECKDLSDLHIKGKLDKDSLLATAKELPKIYWEEITRVEEKEEHVILAEQVMDTLYIKFFNENFYVYENGIYKTNIPKIESCITDINQNARKSLRSEILDYIRIKQYVYGQDIDKNIINFKNGIYNIDIDTLEPHTPDVFTTCQINAEYLDDEEFENLKQSGKGIFIDKFMSDICCNNIDRINTLYEFIGYSMTYDVSLGIVLFLVGETAENGKSTFIELATKLFTDDNYCSVSLEDLSERFSSSDLNNKLLNIVHELPNFKIKDVTKFKNVVTGDTLSVEEKYKGRYKIKPFAHHIFAMNNLPEVLNADEGFFRRIGIVPFERKFTKEEQEQFNFENLITPTSLNYLANKALRAYKAMKDEHRKKFSNYLESESLVSDYKNGDNSITIFLNDVSAYANIIDYKNKVKVKELYEQYTRWCFQNRFQPFNKRQFKNSALASGLFKNAKSKNGYMCFEYIGEDISKFKTYDSFNNSRNIKKSYNDFYDTF